MRALWSERPNCSHNVSQKVKRIRRLSDLLGPVLGRTDFSRIFIFGPPDFFRGFCRRIFSPQFCGKKCPENPPGKSPAKSS